MAILVVRVCAWLAWWGCDTISLSHGLTISGAEDHWTHAAQKFYDFRDGILPDHSAATTVDGKQGKYGDTLFWQRAVQLIQAHAKNDTTVPFFLYRTDAILHLS